MQRSDIEFQIGERSGTLFECSIDLRTDLRIYDLEERSTKSKTQCRVQHDHIFQRFAFHGFLFLAYVGCIIGCFHVSTFFEFWTEFFILCRNFMKNRHKNLK